MIVDNEWTFGYIHCMFEHRLCRLFGHRLHVVSHLDIIFGFHPGNPPVPLAGTSGFCSRCWTVWDDTTGDAMKRVEGDGRPKVMWAYGVY